ncbi:Holliday junction branch migration protein RuvA [Pseudactinotalea sp. HY160]|uniref:Holliday junction branch migration protein RuvA n=1 Tax=Pseudactinotalea sp. HY160 TaxID=2654490 RepID=UPI00128C4CE1|nr:Holliday junction branch migration protein RuvA [Pseudactinotalea sp. HY160]MPV49368.1 Holliday junction branch migration protein RuvA [Pseudactinotalea sp. HY160]
MIASVRGDVLRIGLDSVDVDVSGLGYRVYTTPHTLAQLRHGREAVLATSLVVREEALTLYGFVAVEERDMFETLQTVSGVGPRLALAMLAVHTPDEVRGAIDREDTAALRRVPGVGEKSAKRLVLELQGKLGAPAGDTGGPGPAAGAAAAVSADVLAALEGLGWNPKAAEKAIAAVTADGLDPADTAGVLRAALQALGGTRG